VAVDEADGGKIVADRLTLPGNKSIRLAVDGIVFNSNVDMTVSQIDLSSMRITVVTIYVFNKEKNRP
jgi:hypothetical protein